MRVKTISMKVPWNLVLVFFFLTLVIASTGYLYFDDQARQIKLEKRNELEAIADLKTDQIMQWCSERLADAQVVLENPFVTHNIKTYLERGGVKASNVEILQWMESMRRNHGYSSVHLLGRKGDVRLSIPQARTELGPRAQRLLAEAMERDQVLFSDLHRGPSEQHIHIDIVTPLGERHGSTMRYYGAVLFRIRPEQFLYPLLHSWPTTSRTSESLLIRREGDEIVYLNDLRHQKNTALALRLPITDEQLPAAVAARGVQGVVEGVDYRGVPVLAAVRSIPHTPWFLIAKVDQDEIYAPIRERARAASIVVALLTLIAAGSIVSFWRHKRSQFYRKQYEAELERLALLEHYDGLTKYANDIILLFAPDGKVLDANDRASKAYGYTREELLQLNVRDIRAPETLGLLDKQVEQIAKGEGMVFESVHRRKDGRKFPVESSARVIEVGGKQYYQAIVRDISERKAAEKALFQSRQMLEFVLDHVPQRIFWKDRDFRYLGCNKPFAKDAGLNDPYEILGKDDFELSWKETAGLYWTDDKMVIEQDLAKIGYEEPQSRPNGETLWLRTSKVPLHDEDGKVIGLLGTYEDITISKRAEERLARLNECLVQFGADPVSNINRLVALCGELMGATCALYNRLDGGMLYSVGSWNTPMGYNPLDRPEGHLCYDAIRRTDDGLMIVRNLPGTAYFTTDPNVRAFGLQTYVGRGVRFGDSTVGSLCVVYQKDYVPTGDDEKLMGILAAAIGVEETRRRERETLRETNETLNAIISSAPLAVYDLDAKGNVRKVWNPAAEHIFGWSAKEALGQPLPFVSPEKQSEFSQILGRLLRGEQVNGLDVRRRKKDGSPIDVRLFAAPLRDVHGHIAGAMALVGDVTAQKRAEAALKESEERYKRLVEFSPNAVAVHTEGKFVFVNQAGVKMIGAKSVAELIGKPILDIVHPDYKEIVKARAFQKPGEEKEAPFLEEKFIRFDGTVIDVEVASVPITYQGKPAMQVVARDITNRKRVEEAFRNSESSYRGLFNSVSDAIYIQDKDGRFVDVNNGAVKMYGYPREFFVGKTPAVLAAPGLNDMQKTLNLVKKTFDGEPQRFEWWGKRKNGETFPKEVRLNRGTYFGQDVVIALAQDITERKRAEEQLRQSEEKYRTLFEESKDVIYISSVDGKILDINPAGVELFGFSSKDELLRVDIARDLYWNPDDRNNSQSILRQQGFLKDFEVELKTKGSDKLVCLESSTPMRNERGGIIGYRGVLRNITGRKQAEEEIKKSELRFRRVWESTMDGMRIIDESGNIVMVNEAFCRMTGKSRGELEGKPYHTIYKTESPDEIERDMGLLRQRIASRTVQAHSEVETTLWDGRRVWLELSNSFLEIEEHRPTVLSIFRDITRRRKAEEELQKLSQAVEQSQVSVVITDVFGSIEYVNPKFTEITGYSKEEVLGTNPRILKSGHTSPEQYRKLWETISAGSEWRGEFHNKKKNGELFWESVSISPIRNSKGEITHYLAVKEDITERKKLEHQLVQAQKMESIGTLAAGIAHDFNNILAIILGYASTLERAGGDSKKISTGIEAITTAVERGAGLVRQILTFARKTEFNLEPLNVNSVIGELARMLGETFPKTIRLSLQLEKSLPVISMDHSQLHQALLNLCVNARDAMNDHGSLTIATNLVLGDEIVSRFPAAAGRHYLMISVADTGTGMDEATKRRIFDPFFTTKEKGKGTGLGLAVVFGVVQAHQGFIDVESELGRGSTFKIFLPIPAGVLDQSGVQGGEVADVPGGTETILVIEDEDVLRELLVLILEQKSYRVLSAGDGQTGLQLYLQHKSEIALVLSDMGLPKINGWEVFKKMKAVEPDVTVLIASGYLDRVVKAEILDSGVRGFIEKPYRPEEILKVLREALDSR